MTPDDRLLRSNAFNSKNRRLGVLGIGFPMDSHCQQIARFRARVWNRRVELEELRMEIVDYGVPLLRPWFAWSHGAPVYMLESMMVGDEKFWKVFVRWASGPSNVGLLEWMEQGHGGQIVFMGDGPQLDEIQPLPVRQLT